MGGAFPVVFLELPVGVLEGTCNSLEEDNDPFLEGPSAPDQLETFAAILVELLVECLLETCLVVDHMDKTDEACPGDHFLDTAVVVSGSVEYAPAVDFGFAGAFGPVVESGLAGP